MTTEDQKKAIESRKDRVIVTASAGSGKTHTMVSRVLSLVTEHHVNLSSVVMLTFTEAAAAEMRTRLSGALVSAIKETPREERGLLVEAFDELPLLYCSTIDSFCYKLVKGHFELLGLSPLVTLLDPEQMASYRERAITEVLREYSEEDYQAYWDLTESFGKREEDSLKDNILALYDYAETTEDGDDFLRRARESLDKEIDELPYVGARLREIADFAKDALRTIREKRVTIPSAAPCLKKYHTELLAIIENYASVRTVADLVRARMTSALPSVRSEKEKNTFTQESLYCDEVRALCVAVREKGDFESLPKKGGDPQMFYRTIETARAETRRVIDLTLRFKERFRAIKEEERILDFPDVEHGALTLLKEYDVAREIGCEHLLVDECQDLNPLQDALMRLIAEGGAVFYVGDVKQSIYRFRQSDPTLLGEKIRRGLSEEETDVVEFRENFRSSDAVIDFANTLFERLMTENFGGVDYRKATRGGRTYGSGGVRCFFYPKEKELSVVRGVYSVRDRAQESAESVRVSLEGEWVRDRILELVGSKARRTRDNEEFVISYKDIAILSPKKMGEGSLQSRVVNCLREAGIPLNLGGFIREEESADVFAIVDFLRLIESPMNDYALLSVLRSDLFGVSVETLSEISLLEGDSFSAKAKLASEQGFALTEFYAYLDRMRFLSGTLSLYELVSLLIDERLRPTILKRSDGRKAFGEVLAFAETLKGGKATASISEYLPYFDKYFKMDGSGEVEERDAVNVMTIHGSKGMEFPVVFVIGLEDRIVNDSGNRKVCADREYGVIKEPANDKMFLSELFREKKRKELKEDKLRLLYVAVTRARNYLFLSGGLTEDPGDPSFVLPEPEQARTLCEWVIAGMQGKYGYETEYVSRPRSSRREIASAGDVDGEEVSRLEAAFSYRYPHEKATETGIKYTVTSINDREEEGYYPPTLLFPEEKKQKGTAFHAAMEHIPFTLRSAEETAAFLDKLVSNGVLTEEDRRDLSPRRVFDAMTKVRDLVGERKVLREKSFMLHLSAREAGVAPIDDEVEVQGKIDLLAIGEKDAIVVDYKLSGRSREELAEAYRAQLDLYALAVKYGFGAQADKYIFVLGRNELIKL